MNRKKVFFISFLCFGSVLMGSGCAVDATRVSVAQMYNWDGGHYNEWTSGSTKGLAPSLRVPMKFDDNFPNYFRLTNARLLLGSVYENEPLDVDYV